MEYLEFMKTPMVFGTEYDIIMLCEFLKVSIKVFSPSLFSGPTVPLKEKIYESLLLKNPVLRIPGSIAFLTP